MFYGFKKLRPLSDESVKGRNSAECFLSSVGTKDGSAYSLEDFFTRSSRIGEKKSRSTDGSSIVQAL